MLNDYLSIGGEEVWNTARLAAYFENVGSPFDTGSTICRCDTLTAAILGDDPYTTPDDVDNPAPWFDPDVPDSAQFLGFLPLSLDGIDGDTRTREVTTAVGGGGVYGPRYAGPRNITVTGVLIGASCCGADYGLHWLAEVLSGCCGSACDGDSFEMYNCCPAEGLTAEQFNAQHRRTFRRAAVISGPTVTQRRASGNCHGACGVGSELIEVEFVLTAATPWPWTDPEPKLDVPLPVGGTGDCIEWCVDCNPAECLHADCTASQGCSDPLRSVPLPPTPETPSTGFCVPLAPERACYSIDLGTQPAWSSDVPIVTIEAGSTELRNVRVTMYRKVTGSTQTCDEVADANRCYPANDFILTYLPAGASMTFDGQIGRAITNCNGVCQSSTTAYGDAEGGPVRIRELDCAEYCVCVETDPVYPPAADASVSLSVSGRGY